MAYIVAGLAVIVALIFWWTQKQTRKQDEWRRKKELDIAQKRARLAAKKKADEKGPSNDP